MSERTEVAHTKAQDVAKQEATRHPGESEEFVRPQVDVYEDETGITLSADLPGVSSDRLNLQVDQDTLLIVGEASLDVPEGMQALHAEVRTPRYRRSFALSSELDTEAIEANLKDGVLTLRLPKKAPYQPRKIEVKVD